MGGVGEQQDPRGIGHHLDHLAHQAAGIEHRLADEDAVVLALVDHDALGEGVRIDADQLADQYLVVDQRGGIEQLAQAHVLLGERGEFLHPALHQQRLGLEAFVLGDQLATAAELVAHAFPGAHRHFRQAVERREHHPQLATDGLQIVEPGVHHHQADRQHGQHQQANAQRRAFGE